MLKQIFREPFEERELCSWSQVSSLHRGLDQCAALLSGILQAERTGQNQVQNRTRSVQELDLVKDGGLSVPGSAEPPRTPQRGATQTRQTTCLQKKNLKKFSTKPGPGLKIYERFSLR